MGWILKYKSVLNNKFFLNFIILNIFTLTTYSVAFSRVVDDIEFEFSQLSISKEELLSQLVFEVGDEYNINDIQNSELSLKAFLVQRGYENSRISHSYESYVLESGRKKNKVVFKITEGKATRVRNILIRRSEDDQDVVDLLWKDVEKKVRNSIRIKPGSALDRNLVLQSNGEIEASLVSGEYVGAKVVSVNVYEEESKSSDGDLWADLEFVVETGDRVIFSFRGASFFSKNELLEIVEEQRTVGFGKNYISEIKSRIELEYKKYGFAFVDVKYFSFEDSNKNERRVSFVVSEGKRVRIDNIYFDGNFVFPSTTLVQKFYENSPKLVKKGYFVEGEIKKSIELTVEWLKSQGYLSAKVLSVNTVLIPSELKAEILVYIYEGDQTKIRDIEIVGAEHISADTIQELLGIKEQEPINLYTLSEGLEQLKIHYREKGFLDFKILNEFDEKQPIVSYFQKNQWTKIFLKIEEGPLFKVKDIEIYGLKQTKEEVALREVEILPGDVLTEISLKRSENNLKRLGIFSSVRVKMSDVENTIDQKNIKFVVEESIPGIVGGGVGIRNDIGARAFGEVGYTNLWGMNHSWNLSAEGNRRFEKFRFFEYQFILGYQWPWFLFPKINFRPSLSHEKRQFLKLNASSTSLKLSFDREVWSDPSLTLLFGYNFERVEQFDALVDNATGFNDNQTLRLGSFIPGLRVDTRDDQLSPTRGFFSLLTYEWANPYFGSQTEPYPIGYTIFQLRADQHLPMFSGTKLYLSFRTGFARNTIRDEEIPANTKEATGIPLVKQFALGGTSSLRGFDLQELNKQDFAVRGSLTYVNYRAQIDFPFAGPMTLGPFADAANLNLDKFSFGGLRYGVGFALRYATPVGPVNFDWGFKLNKLPTEENASVFHFSLGLM